tara:strand:- start:167 stop:910 length:744 start_codon:yes stop_codon:yes gene_type:complete
MKKIILIPCRLNSKRLQHKALLEIDKKPLIIHTYLRSSLSNIADDVYVCTDSEKIIDICKKFNAKYIKTKSIHKNGTERIAEACNKLNLSSNDVIIDVQGDEPLIDPKQIDNVIHFFIKNKFEIVVPNIKTLDGNKPNIVKLLVDNKNKVQWMTRSASPLNFNGIKFDFLKHLSIIAFTKKSLIKYSKLKPSKYEKIESIELLRAIENEMNVGSFSLKSESFSIDIIDDYIRAKKFFSTDKIKKRYK